MSWYLRCCPREHCYGDLYDSTDDEGYVFCFQCTREFEKIVKNSQITFVSVIKEEVEYIDEER